MPTPTPQWFVMRDFSKTEKEFAYQRYAEKGFRVFTPLVWQIVGRSPSAKERILAPFIRNLFFIYSQAPKLDDEVARDDMVTYRYLKGFYHKPMTVPEADMNRFIYAVEHSKSVEYYTPAEITPEMFGKHVRIVGGKLDGYEGTLINSLGGRRQRLLIELPGFFSVGVEVRPKYITVIE